MSFLLSIVILSIIYGIIEINVTKEGLNPIVCFCFPIALQVITYYFIFRNEHPVSNKTLYLYALGIISFCVGYFFAMLKKYIYHEDKSYMTPIFIGDLVQYMFILIGMLAIISTILYVLKIMINGPLENIVLNIRWMSLYGDIQRSLVSKYGLFVFGILAEIWLYNSIALKSAKLIYEPFILYAILTLLSTMSRTGLVASACTFIYIFSLKITKKNKTINKTRISLLLMEITCIVLLVLITAKRTGGNIEFFSENSPLYSYVVKSVIQFDETILPLGQKGNGYYCLGPVAKIMELFGFRFKKMGDYISNVGGAVSTYMAELYFDGGIIGLIVMMALHGFIIGFIYRKNLECRSGWLILYVSCIYSMVIAFFDYQFFMSSQIYVAIILYIIKLYVYNGRLYLSMWKRI